jgi:hypothetical protein
MSLIFSLSDIEKVTISQIILSTSIAVAITQKLISDERKKIDLSLFE